MSRECIEIEEVDAALPCDCGGCDWTGTAGDLDPPDGAILTPGDPSPAGRCPACGALAYLNRPEDRARDEAENMATILRTLCDRDVSESAFRAALDRGRALLARLDTPA